LFKIKPSPDDKNLDKVAAIISVERNQRMMMQSARFTVHGKKDALDDINELKNCIKKIKISKESKPNLYNWLYDIGIRQSYLFPDLDNLADEIKKLIFIK
jgi:hypothetical protein